MLLNAQKVLQKDWLSREEDTRTADHVDVKGGSSTTS